MTQQTHSNIDMLNVGDNGGEDVSYDQMHAYILSIPRDHMHVFDHADYEKKSKEEWWGKIYGKELCFTYDSFTDDQIRYIIQDPTIESLDLSMCDKMTPLQVEYILSSSSILHLDLTYVPLNDNLMTKLSNSNLLSLKICFFDNKLQALSQTKIKILHLETDQYENLEDLKYLSNNPDIKCLNLQSFTSDMPNHEIKNFYYNNFATNTTLTHYSDDYGTIDLMNDYRSQIYSEIDKGLNYAFPHDIVDVIFNYCVSGFVSEF